VIGKNILTCSEDSNGVSNIERRVHIRTRYEINQNRNKNKIKTKILKKEEPK
jgi:hypothetical protein